MVSDEYVAGFFDGEGCIRLSTCNGRRGQTYYSLQTTIVNTNKDVLDLIYERFGGSLTKRDTTTSWRECWTLTLQGQRAASFLFVVSPFLVVKKQQVDVGLEFFKAYPPPTKPGPRHYTQKDFEIMKGFKELLQQLKKGQRG